MQPLWHALSLKIGSRYESLHAAVGVPSTLGCLALACLKAYGSGLRLQRLAGTGKLDVIREQCSAPAVGLDWSTTMADARAAFPGSTVLQGNVDPMTLFGPEDAIRTAVQECISQAGPSRHILNVGHGVAQGTPPENVGLFCELARQTGTAQGHKQPAAVC